MPKATNASRVAIQNARLYANAELVRLGTRAIAQDWGTPEQIESQNEFFRLVEERISAAQFERLESYCLKACTHEMIAEGLNLVFGFPSHAAHGLPSLVR